MKTILVKNELLATVGITMEENVGREFADSILQLLNEGNDDYTSIEEYLSPDFQNKITATEGYKVITRAMDALLSSSSDERPIKVKPDTVNTLAEQALSVYGYEGLAQDMIDELALQLMLHIGEYKVSEFSKILFDIYTNITSIKEHVNRVSAERILESFKDVEGAFIYPN